MKRFICYYRVKLVWLLELLWVINENSILLLFPWHRSFLGLFLFRHGLKSELEEISKKFNFLLKGTVPKQFSKAFGALNERPDRNLMKRLKNGWFQKCNFPSRGPPLRSEICKSIWMCRYTGAMKLHISLHSTEGNAM